MGNVELRWLVPEKYPSKHGGRWDEWKTVRHDDSVDIGLITGPSTVAIC